VVCWIHPEQGHVFQLAIYLACWFGFVIFEEHGRGKCRRAGAKQKQVGGERELVICVCRVMQALRR